MLRDERFLHFLNIIKLIFEIKKMDNRPFDLAITITVSIFCIICYTGFSEVCFSIYFWGLFLAFYKRSHYSDNDLVAFCILLTDDFVNHIESSATHT